MKQIIFFDLDGTLADNSHRQHFVKVGAKDWDSFFAAQPKDALNKPVAELFRVLQTSNKFRLFIVTARPERYRAQTDSWLTENFLQPERVVMRRDGDRRNDAEVKKEFLSDMRSEGLEPLFVVDDRRSVVAMWRSEGVVCLQCADHDF